jgi:hypothetical protein
VTASKYHAVKVRDPQFGSFDSKKEYRHWLDLVLMEQAGAISDLERQVPYELSVNGQRICRYVADFRFTRDGQVVVVDAKGVRTRDYVLKSKLMLAIHGIAIEEV